MSQDARHEPPSVDGPVETGSSIRVPSMSAVDRRASVTDLGLDLSDEMREELFDAVSETELSPRIREIVEGDGILGDRQLYLWKWLSHIFGEPLTLSTVPEEHFEAAHEAKTLVSIYITLVDDAAEKLGDEATFWELAKAPYPTARPDWERDDIDEDYPKSTRQVWEALMDRLESAPRFEEFVEPFLFNLRQANQGMDYARLSADYPSFMNPEETWYFETQAIGLYTFWGIDLMFSPAFDHDDYQAFRRVTYELQHMWRLGNWIITWEREVHEHDYSAGVIVEALHQGVIDEADLDALDAGELSPEAVIDRIRAAGLSERFTWNWKQRRDRLRERDFGMSSLDSSEMVAKMEWLMQSHFATEGHR
ncbi:hypothetical protein RYH80_06175 [Halobaculum sp. MBLA0147]|uniref:hypothetical protein n=1 Tax=Halobaculum sp. MBLA0147 TaxID=3079934 RepID=UPI0035268C49